MSLSSTLVRGVEKFIRPMDDRRNAVQMGQVSEPDAGVEEFAGTIKSATPELFPGAIAAAAVSSPGALDPTGTLLERLALEDPNKAVEILALVFSFENPFFPACTKRAYVQLAERVALVKPELVDRALLLSASEEIKAGEIGAQQLIDAGLRGFGQADAAARITEFAEGPLPFAIPVAASFVAPVIQEIGSGLTSDAKTIARTGQQDVIDRAGEAGFQQEAQEQIPLFEEEGLPVVPIVVGGSIVVGGLAALTAALS